MRAKDATVKEIAKAFGMSYQNVCRILGPGSGRPRGREEEHVSKLDALVRNRRRAWPDEGAGSDEHLHFRRAEIEAAAQMVHGRVEGHAPWLVVSEIDDGRITVLLFEYVQGKGFRPPEPCPGEEEALYAWVGESRGYPWGPVCGGDALDEHRHLYIGEDDSGYLYYPDLAMLRAFLDAIEQVYEGAQLR